MLLAKARRQAEAALTEATRRASTAHAEAEREGREAATASLEEAWRRVRSAEADTLAFEERLRAAARRLAERLTVHSLESEPLRLVARTRAALKSVARARRVTLYVSPADAEVLRGHLGELGFDGATVDMRTDPACPRWGLRAETDLGTIDAHVTTQIDRLVASLKPWPSR